MDIYIMILLNVAIFIIGLFFGSFYTLARYRIPKKIDIVRKPSFCPHCNHKLGILEQKYRFKIFIYRNIYRDNVFDNI